MDFANQLLNSSIGRRFRYKKQLEYTTCRPMQGRTCTLTHSKIHARGLHVND